MSAEPHDTSEDPGKKVQQPEPPPKEVKPFYTIQRGKDTIGPDNKVQFADFSARVVSSDVPDKEIDEALQPAPKDSSAQESVASSQSTSQQIAQSEDPSEGIPAPTSADKVSGSLKEPSESSKPDS